MAPIKESISAGWQSFLKGLKRFTIFGSIILVIILGILFYFNYYFVVGEGVKAGELNYFVYKGYVFKTYEGKLIQAGLKSKQGTAMESNEFKFSVTDSVVANKLMRSGGRVLELHYKEYKSPLPWRGVSEFIVDEILE